MKYFFFLQKNFIHFFLVRRKSFATLHSNYEFEMIMVDMKTPAHITSPLPSAS